MLIALASKSSSRNYYSANVYVFVSSLTLVLIYLYPFRQKNSATDWTPVVTPAITYGTDLADGPITNGNQTFKVRDQPIYQIRKSRFECRVFQLWHWSCELYMRRKVRWDGTKVHMCYL